jgi:hypothetical protein
LRKLGQKSFVRFFSDENEKIKMAIETKGTKISSKAFEDLGGRINKTFYSRNLFNLVPML